MNRTAAGQCYILMQSLLYYHQRRRLSTAAWILRSLCRDVCGCVCVCVCGGWVCMLAR